MPAPTGRRRTGPSIRDVAKVAGVSAQTVSRVSTGAENVRAETRTRVLAAMNQLGYSPNKAARALRLGRFGTIGIMSHRYDRIGELMTAASVVHAAERQGYSVNVVSIQVQDEGHWKRAARRMSHQAIDALVIIRAETTTPDALALPADLPVVASDSRMLGHYPAVSVDQAEGTRLVVEHLLGLGHRTVHHISGPEDSEPATIRRSAWLRTLALAGAVTPEPWVGDWTPEAGYNVGLKVAADPSVTAVYAANDEMAMGFMQALFDRGRRVPEDVSVAGFDNLPLSRYAGPPLTTVTHDLPAVGEKLVELVLEQIRRRGTGYVPPARTLIPVELVVRASTGLAPGA